MPKVNLSGMSVEALMDLQKRVDETLHERRAEIEKQLKMFALVGASRRVGGESALKGRKVPPKYRKKLDDFLIDKSERRGRRKRRSKR